MIGKTNKQTDRQTEITTLYIYRFSTGQLALAAYNCQFDKMFKNKNIKDP